MNDTIDTKVVEEVLALVQEAQSPAKFSLAEAIKNRVFPEDVVDVYLDIESAYALSKLNDELTVTFDEEALEKLEAQVEVLKNKILASKLSFHMRGVDQSTVENIRNKYQEGIDPELEDSWVMPYMHALVASNIVKVVNAQGEEDAHEFTANEVKELSDNLPAESWEKLASTTQKLTLASGYFKGLTDAGFLPKF
jgi:hypothetical protein